MKKAVIYARFSSDNQREESIDAQVRAIREYAKRNNFKILKIYADEAKTGRTDNREQFLQMISDSELDYFDYILIHKLDRFSRNRYDDAMYKRILMLNNVTLISVTEQLDGSPESIMLESVLVGMNEYYSANLSREVMKGLKENAHNCKHNGGKPPLGYDVAEDKTYIINTNEAKIVSIIFNMYANGNSYKEIANILNAEGYRTKTGKKFNKNSFYDILRNEKYKGIYVFNKTAKQLPGSKRTHRKHKKESEIIRIDGGMPRIVSDELWDKVRDRMLGNKKIFNNNSKSKEVYLLSGLIQCGECGGPMVGNRRRAGRNKDWYVTYECSTRKRTKECSAKSINKEYFENVVIEDLLDTIFSDSSIKRVIDYYKELEEEFDKEYEKELKVYSNRLKGVETSIANIVAQAEKGFFNESLSKRLTELEEEKSIIEDKMDEASFKRELALPSDEAHITSVLKSYQNIKNIGPNEQRKIIQTYVSSVVVYHDYIKVNKIVDFNGGGGGCRTHVRKSFHKNFSERSQYFYIPSSKLLLTGF